MEVIELKHPLNKELVANNKIVLALGFFDGVHLGHQTVIQQAKAEAVKRNIPLAVMSFNQHPKIVYGGINPKSYKYLTTNNRKVALMEEQGVDIFYIVEYTYAFGTQSPQEFVDNYIVDLQAELVVAGFDYTYGLAEIANMKTLPNHAKGRFDIISVDEIKYQESKVGSTQIKKDIEEGNIERANKNLGYIYEISGTVIHGKKLGRQMGFPTANVQVDHPQLIPAAGVYAVEFMVGDDWYIGAASIGYNITFYEDFNLSCEVYILDFDKYIYGEKVKVRWHHYLRGEVKFDNMEGLIEQLHKDEQDTVEYFKNLKAQRRVNLA